MVEYKHKSWCSKVASKSRCKLHRQCDCKKILFRALIISDKKPCNNIDFTTEEINMYELNNL